jgi:hypothetical protein
MGPGHKEVGMETPLQAFRAGRLRQVRKALENNGFEVHLQGSAAAARDFVIGELVPRLMEEDKVTTASFGGSMSLVDSGLYEAIKAHPELRVLDTYDTAIPRYEVLDLRRRSLQVDLYFTGVNAVTEDGRLVCLDGTGNRVAALAFGPRHVVILAGRNKVAPDMAAAMARIRDWAAPLNASRLERKTPCVKTLHCEDCNSPERICNVWGMVEKCWPKGRIKVVLVDEDLGF